jgi:hypothetical protein
MMTTAPATLTRVHWHHPEWVVTVVAASGWVALVAPVTVEPGLLVRGVHASEVGFGHAAVMAAAMMGPLVLDHAHELAVSSLWGRRYRAVTTYLVGYLGLWAVLGAAGMLALHVALALTETLPLVAVLGTVAVLVARSETHLRRLRRCSATRPLAVTGWRADHDCLDAGVRMGWRCATTSWAVMLLVMAQGGLLTLAAGTAYLVAERRGRLQDRHLARWTLAVVGLAVVATLAGLVPGATDLPPQPEHDGH